MLKNIRKLALGTLFVSTFAQASDVNRWDSITDDSKKQILSYNIDYKVVEDDGGEEHKSDYKNLRLVSRDWHRLADEACFKLSIAAPFDRLVKSIPFDSEDEGGERYDVSVIKYRTEISEDLEYLNSLITSVNPCLLSIRGGKLDDIYFTAQNASLKALRIQDGIFDNYQNLGQNLLYLDISIGTHGTGDLPDHFYEFFNSLSQLENLRTLQVISDHYYNEARKLAPLPTSLESLKIRTNTFNYDLDFEEIPYLLEGDEHLSSLINLKHLFLSGFHLTTLENIPESLEMLQLDKCQIDDFNSLSAHENLRVFQLSSVTPIDISFLPLGLTHVALSFPLRENDLLQMINLKALYANWWSDERPDNLPEALNAIYDQELMQKMFEVWQWDRLTINKKGIPTLSISF